MTDRALALRPAHLVAALVAAILAVAAIPSAPARAASCASGSPLGLATGYTEFVQGDGQRGSESEGAIAYGGSLTASGMTVGTRLSGSKDAPTLVVNGTSNSFNLQSGSAYVPGLTGYINFNGGGHKLTSAPIDFAAAFADLNARSAAWGAQAANGTATVVDSQTTGTALGGNVLLLKGTDNQLNVFSVQPAQLVNIKAVFVDVPTSSTALVNVSGTSVTFAGETRFRNGNTFSQADDNPVADSVKRTLWNLPAATSVTLNTGAAFGGTILAPKADVFAQNVGHNNGQVIAKSFRSNYETHQYLFADNACVPPTTAGSGGGGSTTTTTTATTAPTTPATPTPVAELHVTKTSDVSTVTAGGTVTFTVKVQNTGTGDAAGVVVSDTLPSGLTYASAGNGCTRTGATVRCEAGTVAAGATKSFTITTTADALPVVASDGNDQLAVTKSEQQLSLPAGATQTVRASCDGYASDGSVVVDGVDQGTGTAGDVEVRRLVPTADGSGYEAVVVNHATGQAQGKLYVTCLPRKTTDGHALVVSDPIAQTASYPGAGTATAECGAGRTPIAPGYDVAAGTAIVQNVPTSTTARRFDVQGSAATVTTSVRCLSATTGAAGGSTTALALTPITRTVTVPAGQTVSESLVCGDQAKGIVAGLSLDAGLVSLGHEPQPKTRVFRLWNPTATAKTATLHLLCLEGRTGQAASAARDVTNTATATTTSTQSSGAVLSGSATVRITPGGAQVRSLALSARALRVALACPKACAGSVELRLAAPLTIAGKRRVAGTRLGVAHFRTVKRGAKVVSIALKGTVTRSLRHRQVRLVIRSGGRRTFVTRRL